MIAVQVSRLDGPDSLEVCNIDEPAEPSGAVLIDVHAAGVNFPDLLQTRGEYQLKPSLPFVLGSEVAGVVRRAPDGSQFAPGDRVAAMSLLGAFSESVAVDERFVFALPDVVDFVNAAALPMNFLTMHFVYTKRGRLEAGETVLVHGAAGGIGTAACQLANLFGAHVIAVVSSDEKEQVARAAGAHEVIRVDGFREKVSELTSGRGVDLVVDPVGGDRFTDSLRSLAPEGRHLVVGFTGRDIPSVKVNRLLLGNTAVIGAAWGEYWRRNPAYLSDQWAELLPLLSSRALSPFVGKVYPLAEVSAALKDLDERRATGKIVLSVR